MDRIWLKVYYNKIPVYPIFYLPKGTINLRASPRRTTREKAAGTGQGGVPIRTAASYLEFQGYGKNWLYKDHIAVYSGFIGFGDIMPISGYK